jgi:hypothetical protein
MTKARDIASANPAPSTVSATELGYLDGVSSAIQTQIDGKSGTSHNHNSDYIAKTLTTTTGDIIYASSANTPARLGIGSSGQVLSVSGGVPAWGAAPSGNVVLLASGTISGTSMSFDNVFSSTYNNYYLYWNVTDCDGAQRIRYRVSAADNTTTNYYFVNQNVGFGGTPAFGNLSNGSGVDYLLDLPVGSAGSRYCWQISFTGFNDGSLIDQISYQGFFNRRVSHSGVCFGAFAAGTAFDGFTVYNTGSTFSGTYALYAFKK